MKKSDLFFNVLRLPVDFIMLLTAGLATYILRTEILSVFRPVLFQFNLPLLKYFYLVFFVSLIFLGAYAISGLYAMRAKMRLTEEFLKIAIASSAGVMGIIIYIFLRQELFDSRFLVLGGWFLGIVFVFVGRIVIRKLQDIAVGKYSFGVHRLLIVGDSSTAIKFSEDIKNNPLLGYNIVGIMPMDFDKITQVNKDKSVDEIVVMQMNGNADEVDKLIDFCHEHYIIFKFVPSISNLFVSNYDVGIFEGFPLVELKRTRLEGWGRVIKRVIDILCAIFGLLIALPIFGIIAFAIKWETEGPVFAKLKRVSGNKEFMLYKFRSMMNHAEELKPLLAIYNERNDGPLFKMKEDPRVTKIGRLLRKTRIDELPQLWNILRNDMSLVGPRPHQPDEIEQYKRHHKKVLAIKAGATGLAQVSGGSGLGFEEEVNLDSFYIDNWSLGLDIRIILKTVLKMFFDKTAV